VSPTAGAICHAKPGEQVRKGQPVLELCADDAARIADALTALEGAVEIGDTAPPARPLIADRIAQD
jgi:thymidine phosphorylase